MKKMKNEKYKLWNFMAFSFDYDSKEYVTNLSGFKYINNEENMKPAKINLKDFIIVK